MTQKRFFNQYFKVHFLLSIDYANGMAQSILKVIMQDVCSCLTALQSIKKAMALISQIYHMVVYFGKMSITSIQKSLSIHSYLNVKLVLSVLLFNGQSTQPEIPLEKVELSSTFTRDFPTLMEKRHVQSLTVRSGNDELVSSSQGCQQHLSGFVGQELIKIT